MIQLADEGVCQHNLSIFSGVRRPHLTRKGSWCPFFVVDTFSCDVLSGVLTRQHFLIPNGIFPPAGSNDYETAQ